MAYDLVLTGGLVFTPAGPVDADIAINDSRVAAIGLSLEAERKISVEDRWVLPGGVDPHVHLAMPTSSTVSSDDWNSGTRAALVGGTTTVIDFVEPEADQPLLEAFDLRRQQAEGAAIDYSFHMTLNAATDDVIEQLPAVMNAGMSTFKLYTTYEGFKLEDDSLIALIEAVSQAGGLPIVHAESDAIIQQQTRRMLASAPSSPASHPRSRPAIAEIEALQRVIALTESVSGRVYFVHVSTAGGAQAIARARRSGASVMAETCPQYLTLDESLYESTDFEGAKYVCSPPLRQQSNQAQLWQSLGSGDLQVIATDHCPFNFKGQKDLGREKFTDIPGGLPSIQSRLELVYSAGVRAGPLTPEQWIEVCCANPARIFGLFPRKGALAPGSDADLVIFNPNGERILGHESLREAVDYSPYEGFTLFGDIEQVYTSGTLRAEQGELVDGRNTGSFMKRSGSRFC